MVFTAERGLYRDCHNEILQLRDLGKFEVGPRYLGARVARARAFGGDVLPGNYFPTHAFKTNAIAVVRNAVACLGAAVAFDWAQ